MGPRVYLEDSQQREPGSELYRCAVQAGSQPPLHQGQALRTKARKGTVERPGTQEQQCHLEAGGARSGLGSTTRAL